jgi:hypothetical protein
MATLLAATARAPIARVSPPSRHRTVLIGLLCAAALFSIGWSTLGWNVWATALVGGAACALADRRTTVNKATRYLHLGLVTATLLAAAESLVTQPILGLAAITGAGAGLLLPVDLLTKRPWLGFFGFARPDSHSEGYSNEVLALASFLAQADIPKSLLKEAADEAGVGRATSLRSLMAGALIDTGPDSWHARPMVQEFARKRMLEEERKMWAARAVRMVALRFPEHAKPGDELAERLVPHALVVAGHAEGYDVERGSAAVLLDRVASYLAEGGRAEDALAVRERAIAHASEGFGAASAEVAMLQSQVAQDRTVVSAPGGAASASGEDGQSTLSDGAEGSGGRGLARSPKPVRPAGLSRLPIMPVGIGGLDPASFSAENGSSRRSALAFSFAQTGDVRLEAGDTIGARRDYRAALSSARFSLPRNHPLVVEVRGKLAALPEPARDEDNERRLVVGCFGLVVATVLVCVGFTVVKDLDESGSKASEQKLISADQLVEVCDSNQKYFIDAAAFAGPGPHPAQVFRRGNNDNAFTREPFGGDIEPRRIQLVACALQTRTGPPLTTCKSANQPEIALHEATYQVTVYETGTGRKLGALTVTADKGQCPENYTPPPQGKPWMLYAIPSDDQYRQALQPVLDAPPAAGSAAAQH